MAADILGTVTRRRSFAQVPDDLVMDPAVTDFAVRLWCRLDRYAGRDGRAFPAVERLAEDFQVSVRKITYGLRCLVKTGWITRVRRGQTNIVDTILNDEPVACQNHASVQVTRETQNLAVPPVTPVTCGDDASVQVSPETQDFAVPSMKEKKGVLKETKSGVDQSRSDPTTQTCAGARAAARRPKRGRRSAGPPPGGRGSPEHSFVWGEIIGRCPELAQSPLRFKAARELIIALVDVPEADRAAIGEQLKAEMDARASSAGPDRPSDALRAAREAVAEVLRAPNTPEAIRARLTASQPPTTPAHRAGRCAVHDVALTSAGVCPACRADRLAGDLPD
jgi:hypothetical protein